MRGLNLEMKYGDLVEEYNLDEVDWGKLSLGGLKSLLKKGINPNEVFLRVKGVIAKAETINEPTVINAVRLLSFLTGAIM